MPWDPTEHIVDSLLEVQSFEGTDASEPPDVRQVRELEKMARSFEGVSRSLKGIADVVTRPDQQAALAQAKQRSASRRAAQLPPGAADQLKPDEGSGEDGQAEEHGG